ncbi:uncharacterized protein EV420DRAFT_1650441 [Desarmillaria tabescens]|uniref:Prenyltransferase alpha-alpha toroid domain-containing protein n=1 Tax=Armillaria tabescens TaxID=1929756 RepID=A0AA39JDC0_ARMTA|nr:uncharacterized protein EV420DRAFT_1650441 [Desarmillaria tabescens]KAK0440691.1 hypothetical protein EV420DRAFT_1650441 [Desarmillaria tabescens]
MSAELLVPFHISYIQNLGKSKDDLAYHLNAHLRMNTIYWGLTALCIMGHQDALHREEKIDYVFSCWDEEAGSTALCSRIALCLRA